MRSRLLAALARARTRLLGLVRAPGIVAWLFFLTIPLSAYQAGQLTNHAHTSTAGDGGSSITPANLTVTSNAQFNANVKISSKSFTVDGTGATVNLPSGVSLTNPTIVSYTGLLTVSASTQNLSAFTAANTVPSACITGSTLTLTTVTGRDVEFSGQMAFTADGVAQVTCLLQVDGAFTGFNQVPALGIANWTNLIAFTDQIISLNWSIPASQVTAATHKYCVACSISVGNWYHNRTGINSSFWKAKQSP